MSVEIRLDNPKGSFQPGDEISGDIVWKLDEQPKRVALNLIWYTEGKGTQDHGIVNTVADERPATHGEKPFRFTLPKGPYSFSGKLITLAWALEAVVEPTADDDNDRHEFVLSPSGEEIRLNAAG